MPSKAFAIGRIEIYLGKLSPKVIFLLSIVFYSIAFCLIFLWIPSGQATV
jgi:hypothetical protein